MQTQTLQIWSLAQRKGLGKKVVDLESFEIREHVKVRRPGPLLEKSLERVSFLGNHDGFKPRVSCVLSSTSHTFDQS